MIYLLKIIAMALVMCTSTHAAWAEEAFNNPHDDWPVARAAALNDSSWQSAYNAARVALAAQRSDIAIGLLVLAHQRDLLAEEPVLGLRQLEVPLPTTRQEYLGPFAFSQSIAEWLLFLGALGIAIALIVRPQRLGFWLAGGCVLLSLALPSAIGRSILVTHYSAVATPVVLVDNAGWPLSDLPSGTILRHEPQPKQEAAAHLQPVTAIISHQSTSGSGMVHREQFGYIPATAWIIPETLQPIATEE